MKRDKYNFAFTAWKTDNSFREDFLSLVASADLISFDIFDTSVTRVLESPVDVFAEVEKRMVAKFGHQWHGFADSREKAENNVRKRLWDDYGVEDVTLSEIYEELSETFLVSLDWKEALRTELTVELDVTVAVPDILGLTNILNDKGIPYIFVSDMYLSSEFLSRMLSAKGYNGWQDIYVSSEFRKSKASGNIWDIVQTKYQDRILHIGDDLHADVIKPVNHGVSTLHYKRVISERRCYRTITPDILPFSLFKRKLTLLSCQKTGCPSNTNLWFDLGKSLGGFLLVSFIKWLADRVVLHKLDRLYFCSRDGFLLQKAWEVSGFAKRVDIDYKYLYISRSAINIPSGIKGSSSNKLSQRLLVFFGDIVSDQLTLRDIFERAGLLALPLLREDGEKNFGSLFTVLKRDRDLTSFYSLLQRHSADIYSLFEKRYDVCKSYFSQEGLLAAGRHGLVDLGWHGTLQRDLRYLIGDKTLAEVFFGFYYGLWRRANGNRYLAGVMESFLATPFLPWSEQAGVWFGLALLEELHSAPHGSVKEYKVSEAGQVIPVFHEVAEGMAEHISMVSEFQRGALQTVEEAFGSKYSSLPAQEMNRETALAALASLILSPSLSEIKMISSLQHCPTFDHLNHQAFIVEEVPDNQEQAYTILKHSPWPVGQLKYWLTKNITPEQRAFLQRYGRESLTFLGDRVVRQF